MSAPKLMAAATRSADSPGGRLGFVERRANGGMHVRARVAVRDREDVEAVDLLDVGLEIGDGGPERLEEPGAVTGPARHQATSVPLSARSRGRIAAGSAWTVDRRRPAGLDAQAVDVDHQPADSRSSDRRMA